MPTDLVRAFSRRRVADRRDFWHQTVLVTGISLAGSILTVARVLQSEAFETSFVAFATIE